MTKVYRDRELANFYDQNSGRVFADKEFYSCRFVSSAVSITRNPRRRSTLRNLRFIDCEQIGSALEAAIVEDVVVDGFRTNGDFAAWAAVFKHVVLRGNVGQILFSPLVAAGMASSEEQRAFDSANAAYYATVDWALDIREAFFVDADLRSVPGRLIRRDPETQVLVTRAKALQGAWRHLDLTRTHWPTVLDFFLKQGSADIVLVASKRAHDFKRLLAGLQMLRDAGVAEPD
jgi:hypothetical protein